MDKLSIIVKVAEFREINFGEWSILDFSRDKLSRKRENVLHKQVLLRRLFLSYTK